MRRFSCERYTVMPYDNKIAVWQARQWLAVSVFGDYIHDLNKIGWID